MKKRHNFKLKKKNSTRYKLKILNTGIKNNFLLLNLRKKFRTSYANRHARYTNFFYIKCIKKNYIKSYSKLHKKYFKSLFIKNKFLKHLHQDKQIFFFKSFEKKYRYTKFLLNMKQFKGLLYTFIFGFFYEIRNRIFSDKKVIINVKKFKIIKKVKLSKKYLLNNIINSITTTKEKLKRIRNKTINNIKDLYKNRKKRWKKYINSWIEKKFLWNINKKAIYNHGIHLILIKLLKMVKKYKNKVIYNKIIKTIYSKNSSFYMKNKYFNNHINRFWNKDFNLNFKNNVKFLYLKKNSFNRFLQRFYKFKRKIDFIYYKTKIISKWTFYYKAYLKKKKGLFWFLRNKYFKKLNKKWEKIKLWFKKKKKYDRYKGHFYFVLELNEKYFYKLKKARIIFVRYIKFVKNSVKVKYRPNQKTLIRRLKFFDKKRVIRKIQRFYFEKLNSFDYCFNFFKNQQNLKFGLKKFKIYFYNRRFFDNFQSKRDYFIKPKFRKARKKLNNILFPKYLLVTRETNFYINRTTLIITLYKFSTLFIVTTPIIKSIPKFMICFLCKKY